MRFVNKLWVVIGLLVASQIGMTAQLVVFSFDGAVGNEMSFTPDNQPIGASVGGLQRGSGIGLATGSGAFSARSWSPSGLDANDFFSFSVMPDPGFQLDLSGLEFDERRSSTGIREWTVRSSLDDFAFDLSPGPVGVPDNSATRRDQRIDLSAETYSGLTGAVEFRIYGYGAESSAGTWRIDNLELMGGISVVPEPSDWMGFAGMGLLLVGLYRRLRGINLDFSGERECRLPEIRRNTLM